MSKLVQHIYSFDVEKVLFMFKIYYVDTKRNELVKRKLCFEHSIRLLSGDISYFSKHYEATLIIYKRNTKKYKYVDVPKSVHDDLNYYISVHYNEALL